MKSTGIIRRIDDLGRIMIPKETRRTLGIEEGDAMELFPGEGGTIIFRKYDPTAGIEDLVNELIDMLGDADTIKAISAESVCATKAVLQILKRELAMDRDVAQTT